MWNLQGLMSRGIVPAQSGSLLLPDLRELSSVFLVACLSDAEK